MLAHLELVHHVPLPVRDHLLQIISQQLAPDVYPQRLAGGKQNQRQTALHLIGGEGHGGRFYTTRKIRCAKSRCGYEGTAPRTSALRTAVPDRWDIPPTEK